ncbi:hypothetical protein CRUP_016833 [Coryphaenoides rupestris]|nr:hypothetical protein CRUP_016833 [Coryphaenoides rupestris]
MFSVAVLLLLLAAGSGVECEQLTQPESLTIRPGQPLSIRCQLLCKDKTCSLETQLCITVPETHSVTNSCTEQQKPFSHELTQPESLTIRPGQPLSIRCQVSYSVSSYYTVGSDNLMEADWNGLDGFILGTKE